MCAKRVATERTFSTVTGIPPFFVPATWNGIVVDTSVYESPSPPSRQCHTRSRRANLLLPYEYESLLSPPRPRRPPPFSARGYATEAPN